MLDTCSFRDVHTNEVQAPDQHEETSKPIGRSQLSSSVARGAAFRLIVMSAAVALAFAQGPQQRHLDGYPASRARLMRFLSDHAAPDAPSVSATASIVGGRCYAVLFSHIPRKVRLSGLVSLPFCYLALTQSPAGRLGRRKLKAAPHPHIRSTLFQRHGYVLLHVNRQERAQSGTSCMLLEPDRTHVVGKRLEVRRGTAHLQDPDATVYDPGGLSLQL